MLRTVIAVRGVVRRAAPVLTFAVLLGCGSLHPDSSGAESPSSDVSDLGLWRRPPVSEAASLRFEEAKRLRGLGRIAEAVESAAAAVDLDPGYLEANRLLQDLLTRTTADWWLRERYERRLREHPNDPDAWYLLARIESDPDRQDDLFSEALSRDPRHPYATLGRAISTARRGDGRAALAQTRRATDAAPWLALPWLWLGGESMKHGDCVGAARFFESARDRAKDDPRAWLGIADAGDELGRRDESVAAALEALRLAPGDESVCVAATEILSREGTGKEFASALETLAKAEKDGASSATCAMLRGRLLLASGRPAEADVAFDAAVAGGVAATEIVVPRRLARVLAGRYREAVACALDATPKAAFARSNLYASRWRRLAAAAERDLEDPRGLLELAEAMASLGWLQESRTVLAAAAAKSPDDAVVAARLRSENAFGAFISDLGRIARETRDGGRDGSSGPSVRDVLARIGDASRARLGGDVSRGAAIHTYPMLGEFAVSAASSSEFETTFGSHGLMCLVGSRNGSPTDLVLGRLAVLRAGSEERVLDRDITCDECWIESEGLPADAAGLHRGLAGLTLDRLVVLQLDSVRRGARPRPSALPFLLRRATTDAERRALDTPSDVGGRIELQIAAEGRLAETALDAVRRHELVHVYDAARLLPVSSHPFEAFAFGLSHGFSGSSMERTLEARAQTISILSAEAPRLALAALLAFLPSKDGDTPHVGGYCAAAQNAVDILIGDPASFPSIDPTANVLQQMDRLSDAEVRELARRLIPKL